MSSDYSQIELRVFAHMSNVSELIDAFKKGYDIHTKTAADINHVPIELVTKDMRRKAKAVNFGIIYGISSFGLSEDLRISPTEAKMFIEDYFNTYPGVKDYMNKVIAEAHEKGYVKTITNRKRIIEELNNKMVEMLRPTGVTTPIEIVFQSIEGLHEAIPNHKGDWYFTGNFPTPGGMKLVNQAFINYIENVYQYQQKF